MALYTYNGPVFDGFGKMFEWRWKAETDAPSKAKAKSNLEYQYKKASGREVRTRVSISGDMIKQ